MNWKGIYSRNLGQYHGHWCPGSLFCQGVGNHDIECKRNVLEKFSTSGVNYVGIFIVNPVTFVAVILVDLPYEIIGYVVLVAINGTTILMPYFLSQVPATYIMMSHLYIWSMGVRSSNELQPLSTVGQSSFFIVVSAICPSFQSVYQLHPSTFTTLQSTLIPALASHSVQLLALLWIWNRLAMFKLYGDWHRTSIIHFCIIWWLLAG